MTHLGEVVGPDLVSEIYTLDLTSPTGPFPLHLFRMLPFRQTSSEDLPCPFFVLMLTSGILH